MSHEVVSRAMDPAGVAACQEMGMSEGGRVSMPQRSHPDSAKTPGCNALNITSIRCARRMGPMSSIRLRSDIPSVAAMTVAAVQAIPFVVNTRLYGDWLPMRPFVRSLRITSPSS